MLLSGILLWYLSKLRGGVVVVDGGFVAEGGGDFLGGGDFHGVRGVGLMVQWYC